MERNAMERNSKEWLTVNRFDIILKKPFPYGTTKTIGPMVPIEVDTEEVTIHMVDHQNHDSFIEEASMSLFKRPW